MLAKTDFVKIIGPLRDYARNTGKQISCTALILEDVLDDIGVFQLIQMDFTWLTLRGAIGIETLRKVATSITLQRLFMTRIDTTHEAFIFNDLKTFLCRDQLVEIYIASSGLSHVIENVELLSGLLVKPEILFSVSLKDRLVIFGFRKSDADHYCRVWYNNDKRDATVRFLPIVLDNNTIEHIELMCMDAGTPYDVRTAVKEIQGVTTPFVAMVSIHRKLA